MKKLLATTALAAGLAMGTSAATAGDFEGAYAGAYGAYTFGGTFGAGLQAGYLWEFANGAYTGIEADVMAYPTVAPSAYMRLGYDFGSDFMLGAKVGAGYAVGSGTPYYGIGATAQYQFGSGMGIRADVERLQSFSGGAPAYMAKAGLYYNF